MEDMAGSCPDCGSYMVKGTIPSPVAFDRDGIAVYAPDGHRFIEACYECAVYPSDIDAASAWDKYAQWVLIGDEWHAMARIPDPIS